ncbi:hypothetical protein NDU88_000714 [Pleurodeles waltl]|uniref:Uncharacterized protein n=1 Tax=Pleurodeles waltl TaxID=8319 RepID=A0AAV7L980_PLEWA|nr:hypothetical protein NDU88_000714 [Pleurodeles waltl]
MQAGRGGRERRGCRPGEEGMQAGRGGDACRPGEEGMQAGRRGDAGPERRGCWPGQKRILYRRGGDAGTESRGPWSGEEGMLARRGGDAGRERMQAGREGDACPGRKGCRPGEDAGRDRKGCWPGEERMQARRGGDAGRESRGCWPGEKSMLAWRGGEERGRQLFLSERSCLFVCIHQTLFSLCGELWGPRGCINMPQMFESGSAAMEVGPLIRAVSVGADLARHPNRCREFLARSFFIHPVCPLT